MTEWATVAVVWLPGPDYPLMDFDQDFWNHLVIPPGQGCDPCGPLDGERDFWNRALPLMESLSNWIPLSPEIRLRCMACNGVVAEHVADWRNLSKGMPTWRGARDLYLEMGYVGADTESHPLALRSFSQDVVRPQMAIGRRSNADWDALGDPEADPPVHMFNCHCGAAYEVPVLRQAAVILAHLGPAPSLLRHGPLGKIVDAPVDHALFPSGVPLSRCPQVRFDLVLGIDL